MSRGKKGRGNRAGNDETKEFADEAAVLDLAETLEPEELGEPGDIVDDVPTRPAVRRAAGLHVKQSLTVNPSISLGSSSGSSISGPHAAVFFGGVPGNSALDPTRLGESMSNVSQSGAGPLQDGMVISLRGGNHSKDCCHVPSQPGITSCQCEHAARFRVMGSGDGGIGLCDLDGKAGCGSGPPSDRALRAAWVSQIPAGAGHGKITLRATTGFCTDDEVVVTCKSAKAAQAEHFSFRCHKGCANLSAGSSEKESPGPGEPSSSGEEPPASEEPTISCGEGAELYNCADTLATNLKDCTNDTLKKTKTKQKCCMCDASETENPNSSGSSTCNGQVQIFQHGDFGGWKAEFSKGSYPFKEFTSKGARNDDASSLKVPAGCKATLYQHGDKSGWSATFGPGDYNYHQLVAAGARNDDASSMDVVDSSYGETPAVQERLSGKAPPVQEQNLALNKPAKQSSTRDCNGACPGGKRHNGNGLFNDYSAQRVVDGNVNHVVLRAPGSTDNPFSNTKEEDDPWWEVDLGKKMQVGTVRVSAGSACNRAQDGFSIKVGDTYCGKGLVVPPLLVSDFRCNATGQTVRIELPGKKRMLCMLQVEIFKPLRKGEFSCYNGKRYGNGGYLPGMNEYYKPQYNNEACKTCNGAGPTECTSCTGNHALVMWRGTANAPEGSCHTNEIDTYEDYKGTCSGGPVKHPIFHMFGKCTSRKPINRMRVVFLPGVGVADAWKFPSFYSKWGIAEAWHDFEFNMVGTIAIPAAVESGYTTISGRPQCVLEKHVSCKALASESEERECITKKKGYLFMVNSIPIEGMDWYKQRCTVGDWSQHVGRPWFKGLYKVHAKELADKDSCCPSTIKGRAAINARCKHCPLKTDNWCTHVTADEFKGWTSLPDVNTLCEGDVAML